jgi:hypothetical protein
VKKAREMKPSDPFAPETFELRCYLPCQVSWITGLDRERIIYPAIRSGRLVARRLGPNVVITDDDLRQFLAGLPRAGGFDQPNHCTP